MAVEVGVTHKPDVIMHALTPEDKYLIVASDGVWELVSSQVSCCRWIYSRLLTTCHKLMGNDDCMLGHTEPLS